MIILLPVPVNIFDASGLRLSCCLHTYDDQCFCMCSMPLPKLRKGEQRGGSNICVYYLVFSALVSK